MRVNFTLEHLAYLALTEFQSDLMNKNYKINNNLVQTKPASIALSFCNCKLAT